MSSRRKVKKQPLKPERGARCSFVAGSYEGEKGWYNVAKQSTAASTFVIVDLGQPEGDDAEFATHVRPTNVVPFKPNPQSLEEFVVQEDPKVAHHLAGLSVALAEAGIEEVTDDLLVIIKALVDSAIILQKDRGRKAKYSATANLERLRKIPVKATFFDISLK